MKTGGEGPSFFPLVLTISSRTSGLFPFILKFLFAEKKIGSRADGLITKSGSSTRMNTLGMGLRGTIVWSAKVGVHFRRL